MARHPLSKIVPALVLALAFALFAGTAHAIEEVNPYRGTLPAEEPYDPDQRIIISEPADGMKRPTPPERVEIFFRGLEFDLIPQSLELWIDGVEYTESLRFWQDRAWMDIHPDFEWLPRTHTILCRVVDDFGNVFEETSDFDIAAPPTPDGYPWPFDPTGEPNVVSNLMEDWQDFGAGDAYWHSGIDIRVPAGTPIKACRGGEVVKVINYVIQNVTDPDLYWEIAIQDADGFIWQYHHVDPATITVQEGDNVFAGDVLGEVIEWSNNFKSLDGAIHRYDHLHLNVVWYWGGGPIPGPYEEGFTYYNPLLFLTKGTYADTIAPASFDVWFAQNEHSSPDAAASDPQTPVLDGYVDVITKLRDRMTEIPPVIGQPFELGIYEVAWEVRPKGWQCLYSYMPRTTLYRFDAIPGLAIEAQQEFRRDIYKGNWMVDGQQEGTYFDNWTQRFVYVPTNTYHGVPDRGAGTWRTTEISEYGTGFPDGEYTVIVYAKDFHGNETATSVDVILDNGLDPNEGCPGWISGLTPGGGGGDTIDLVYGPSGERASTTVPEIPLSFGDIFQGSAHARIDHDTWPILEWELPTHGVKIAVGLLDGEEVEVEYVPYLGDVILEIPAEAQVLPLSAGTEFDPDAPSTNPVQLRLSTRLARDPMTGVPAYGTPEPLGGGEFTMHVATEMVAMGLPMAIVTPAGGLVSNWNTQTTGVQTADVGRLEDRMARAFPNPFNPATTIEYSLPEASDVHLSIFDVTGARVTTLETGDRRSGGTHRSRWDGRDASGKDVASGVYFYRLDYRTAGRAKAESGTARAHPLRGMGEPRGTPGAPASGVLSFGAPISGRRWPAGDRSAAGAPPDPTPRSPRYPGRVELGLQRGKRRVEQSVEIGAERRHLLVGDVEAHAVRGGRAVRREEDAHDRDVCPALDRDRTRVRRHAAPLVHDQPLLQIVEPSLDRSRLVVQGRRRRGGHQRLPDCVDPPARVGERGLGRLDVPTHRVHLARVDHELLRGHPRNRSGPQRLHLELLWLPDRRQLPIDAKRHRHLVIAGRHEESARPERPPRGGLRPRARRRVAQVPARPVDAGPVLPGDPADDLPGRVPHREDDGGLVLRFLAAKLLPAGRRGVRARLFELLLPLPAALLRREHLVAQVVRERRAERRILGGEERVALAPLRGAAPRAPLDVPPGVAHPGRARPPPPATPPRSRAAPCNRLGRRSPDRTSRPRGRSRASG